MEHLDHTLFSQGPRILWKNKQKGYVSYEPEVAHDYKEIVFSGHKKATTHMNS